MPAATHINEEADVEPAAPAAPAASLIANAPLVEEHGPTPTEANTTTNALNSKDPPTAVASPTIDRLLIDEYGPMVPVASPTTNDAYEHAPTPGPVTSIDNALVGTGIRDVGEGPSSGIPGVESE